MSKLFSKQTTDENSTVKWNRVHGSKYDEKITYCIIYIYIKSELTLPGEKTHNL